MPAHFSLYKWYVESPGVFSNIELCSLLCLVVTTAHEGIHSVQLVRYNDQGVTKGQLTQPLRYSDHWLSRGMACIFSSASEVHSCFCQFFLYSLVVLGQLNIIYQVLMGHLLILLLFMVSYTSSPNWPTFKGSLLECPEENWEATHQSEFFQVMEFLSTWK